MVGYERLDQPMGMADRSHVFPLSLKPFVPWSDGPHLKLLSGLCENCHGHDREPQEMQRYI